MNYPEQIDLVWLAVDEVGNLAAMITGGAGPIPSSVLAHGDKVLDIEEALLALPLLGAASIHVQVPNPSSFEALGKRGLFVYDWADVHRPIASALKTYELVASPSDYLNLGDMPASLKALATPLSGSVQFGCPALNVRLGSKAGIGAVSESGPNV
jgi:hypothetical protein